MKEKIRKHSAVSTKNDCFRRKNTLLLGKYLCEIREIRKEIRPFVIAMCMCWLKYALIFY